MTNDEIYAAYAEAKKYNKAMDAINAAPVGSRVPVNIGRYEYVHFDCDNDCLFSWSAYKTTERWEYPLESNGNIIKSWKRMSSAKKDFIKRLNW